MSNVLIGIIGVILFIGLALAGALILGDDFKSASAGSKASATMAQAQQIAAAINMYKLKTGRNMTTLEYRDNATALLVPRFLKAVPTFPNPAGGSYQIQDTSGLNNNNNPVFIVAADLPRSASSLAICEAAAEGFGKEIENGYFSMTPGTAGCVYSSADPLYFAIYVKI